MFFSCWFPKLQSRHGSQRSLPDRYFRGRKQTQCRSSLLLLCCCWGLRHFLTSQVISVASDIEREKSDKFCSEALISTWGSFTCRKSTTRDPRLYFPSEGSYTQDFYALKNPSTLAGIEPANLGSSGEYDNRWTTGVDFLLLQLIDHPLCLSTECSSECYYEIFRIDYGGVCQLFSKFCLTAVYSCSN